MPTTTNLFSPDFSNFRSRIFEDCLLRIFKIHDLLLDFRSTTEILIRHAVVQFFPELIQLNAERCQLLRVDKTSYGIIKIRRNKKRQLFVTVEKNRHQQFSVHSAHSWAARIFLFLFSPFANIILRLIYISNHIYTRTLHNLILYDWCNNVA